MDVSAVGNTQDRRLIWLNGLRNLAGEMRERTSGMLNVREFGTRERRYVQHLEGTFSEWPHRVRGSFVL